MTKIANEHDSLRKAAEAEIVRPPLTLVQPQPGEELLHDLIHELSVYQIELEMQNVELRQSQQSQEEAMARYVDLYDFAPVGYLTLTGKTVIVSANLKSAEMLGVDRNKLIQKRFASFVTPHDSDHLHLCLQSALRQGKQQTCDLELKRGDGSVLHVRLDCLQSKIGKELSIRVALSDITELKQAALSLQNEREKNQLFLRNASDDSSGSQELVGDRWHG